MALPTELKDLRSFTLAAKRKVDELDTEEFSLPLAEIKTALNRAWEWIEEYTQHLADAESEAEPEVEQTYENAGGPTHWEPQREWDG